MGTATTIDFSSLPDWQEKPEDFRAALKRCIEALGNDSLPLQQGLSQGGYALDDPLSAMILDIKTSSGKIEVRLGIFYTGIIAGCSCTDDPTPQDITTEYCVVRVEIDENSRRGSIELDAD